MALNFLPPGTAKPREEDELLRLYLEALGEESLPLFAAAKRSAA